MSLKWRRLIYSVFIVIFFAVSLVIILYALGYKYNWSKKIFEKTGVYYIKSFPKNAAIFLNDRQLNKRTPALINRLLPNNYSIKVSKTGYFSWEKNLPILPQTTTFIEDIALFKNELTPQLLATGEFSGPLPSLDKTTVIFNQKNADNYSLGLFNVLTEKLTMLEQTVNKNPWQLISWSNNNHKFLLKQHNDYFIINLEQKNVLYPLTAIGKLKFTKLIWDYYNDNLLYGLSNQKLYQIDLLNETIAAISDLPILSMISYQTDVLAIVKEQNKYLLKFIKSNKPPLLTVPFSDNYDFYNPGYNMITLTDQDQQTLYLLEPENNSQPIKTVIKNLKNYQWYDDQFLYWNNNELWVYYPDVNQNILIERSSQPILDAFWHPNIVYLYSLNSQQLKIYELDGRDKRNVYTLFNFSNTQNNFAFPNKKGDVLFILTSLNDVSGLYRMAVQ